MLVMLRHADRIKIGCATGGLGALCATDREHVWKGAAYYPFAHMIGLAKGVSLCCEVACETYDVPGYAIDDMNQYGGFEKAMTVQAAAALDEEAGELNLFVINADLDEDQELRLDARGFEGWQFREHIEIFAENPDDANTWNDPGRILPHPNPDTRAEGGLLTARLRKESWNVFRFQRSTRV
jgi:alpha-N-arabinofuranosidase